MLDPNPSSPDAPAPSAQQDPPDNTVTNNQSAPEAQASVAQASVAQASVAQASVAQASATETVVPETVAAEELLPHARHRVLVVESDLETADLVVSVLENAGYDIEVATDGQYALMLLDSFEPHLILLGLSMPGMSGLEITQVLRGEPRFAQRFRATRIFYLTDKTHMLQNRFSSLPGTPMSDYIFKPVDMAELLEKARRVFADHAPHN